MRPKDSSRPHSEDNAEMTEVQMLRTHPLDFLKERVRGYVAILLLLLLPLLPVQGQVSDGSEDVEVSVLTCSPGQEVYSLYGHTAIRVRNRLTGKDEVYNYGVFDFNSDFFIWNFVLGKTDYLCVSIPWEYFQLEYRHRGSSITAQVLRLTPEETTAICNALAENVKPQNAVYRYNYLTNNCTTRVMDLVEACVQGQVVYSWHEEPLTYRQLIHKYTENHLWAREGNDVLLGADVDTILCHRATCFLPEYYMDALAGAQVRNEFKDTRPLVAETITLLHARAASSVSPENRFPLTPMQLGWGIFAFFLIVFALEAYTHRVCWPLDLLIMLAHGLAGCMILFVFLFSEHPTLDSNWLVGILNPIPLLLLPSVAKAAWHGRPSIWHPLMAVWMALYLLFMPWIPQHMCSMTVPLVLTLLVRQIPYIMLFGIVPQKAAKHSEAPKTAPTSKSTTSSKSNSKSTSTSKHSK